MKSFKVGVKTPGDTDWCFNAQRWATEEQATQAGKDLYRRWTAVKEWKVFPSTDEPNMPNTPGQRQQAGD